MARVQRANVGSAYLMRASAAGLIAITAGSAMADRKGSWDGTRFLAPIVEPDNKSSLIALHDGNFRDNQLASMVFSDADTKIDNYFNLQFVFEACESGGFIGDLAALDGKESSLGDPNKRRRDIGVMTATSWDKPSYFEDDRAYSFFPHGFTESVKAPHPAGDNMLDAFKAASLEVKNEIGLDNQAPQYWSYGDRQDSDTLQTASDPRDYAFLVVNPDDKNVEKEFWNDLVAMRDVMLSDYGWTDAGDDQLIVLFADGTKPNFVQGDIDWIDGPASSVKLGTELARVNQDFSDLSLGFFYFGGHGAACAIPAPSTVSLLALGTIIAVRRRRA